MNRFLFGRGWVCCDEADNTGGAGGAGGGAAAPGGEGGGEGGGEDDNVDAGGEAGGEGGDKAGAAAAKEEAPKDMKAAIDAALGYKKGPNGEELDPLTGKAKVAVEKPGAQKQAAGKETETHHANGKPKKDDKGQDIDPEGKAVQKAAPKVKTAAELDMKPEEKKLLGTKAQIRFGEVINTLKAHEGTIANLTTTNKALVESRDAILGVMEETKTTPDQLSGYLEFNALLQSNDPKDLESALTMIEDQRAALYAKLGREPEGGGLDLLKDFPDLAKQVEEEEITRKAALEIAHNRREKAARENTQRQQQQRQQSQQQTAQQQKAAGEKALKEIETWTAGLSKSDLDYKAKEDRLLGETLTGVLKDYPPHLWLPTLKRLYAGIVVEKAASVTGGQKKPLRPSGARPGAKAPNDMLDAINQGLGYAGAEKG